MRRFTVISLTNFRWRDTRRASSVDYSPLVVYSVYIIPPGHLETPLKYTPAPNGLSTVVFPGYGIYSIDG